MELLKGQTEECRIGKVFPETQALMLLGNRNMKACILDVDQGEPCTRHDYLRDIHGAEHPEWINNSSITDSLLCDLSGLANIMQYCGYARYISLSYVISCLREDLD